MVGTLLSNWCINIQHVSRALAEMAYFMVVWPLGNLLDEGKLTPEQLLHGAPNQNQEKMLQFIRLVVSAQEFHRAANLSKTADRAIRIIVGGPGRENPRNDHKMIGIRFLLRCRKPRARYRRGAR